LAVALLLGAFATSSASATRGDAEAIGHYVRARLADSAGAPEQAAPGYAVLLSQQPDDPALALRAWRGAIGAGDMALALRAARLLDARGVLPAEGRLVLVAEAISTRDWPAARLAVDRVEEEQAFEFLAPILRAWINLGAGEGPTSALLQGRLSGLTAAYAGEQRALLLLAEGKAEEGAGILQAMGSSGPGLSRDAVRIAAASRLIALRNRDAALSLLIGDDPDLVAARALAVKRRLPAMAQGAAGAAFLLVRLAEDIQRQQPTPLALSLVRVAGMLDPRNDAVHLMIAGMLAADGRSAGALGALDRVNPKGPWTSRVNDARVQLLAERGQGDAALALATRAAGAKGAGPQDWTRLGGVQGTLNRYADSAASYARAIDLTRAAGTEPNWTLWMLKGSAYEQAGDWENARPALTKAAELAPDQPAVLNYLGYAQLERRENLEEAERLIRRASELRPKDSAITDSLGWAYYVRGNLPMAIETLERAAAGQPDEPTINEHLGDAYWAAGRRIDARYAWRAALLGADAQGSERLRTKIDLGPPAQ
jgi:tetratricopeptide (TPR) repeat protein